VVDGEDRVAMAGVCPYSDSAAGERGRPWMVGVDGLERHKRVFASMTAPLTERMLVEYPWLSNVVHNANQLSIAWLRRSGFTIGEPETDARTGVVFCQFHKVRAGWGSLLQSH
jgi:hypothetical protein